MHAQSVANSTIIMMASFAKPRRVAESAAARCSFVYSLALGHHFWRRWSACVPLIAKRSLLVILVYDFSLALRLSVWVPHVVNIHVNR